MKGNSFSPAEILDKLDDSRILKLAQELVRIPSENPPGNEEPVAAYLGQVLRAMGMQVKIKDLDVHPGRPNVVATWDTGRDGPVLILNGHIDVVPAGDGWSVDPFGGEVKEGKLYGRGACDMKGPIAAVVGAVEAIQHCEVPIRGKIVITAVAGEEEDQSGTRQLVTDGIQADYAICAEPTGLVPIIAHKGDFYYDITTLGRAAHGSIPHLGINAVIKMVPVIERVVELSKRLERKSHPLCGHPTVSIGIIKGGNITCAVPDRCTISLDRRLIPGETAEEATAEIEAIVDEIARLDPEFRATIENPVKALPMEISADEPIVLALRRQTEMLTGKDPGIHGWSATCDANMLVNDLGIPTCIFGPGDIAAYAHKPDEAIDIDEMMLGAQIYALTILDLLGG